MFRPGDVAPAASQDKSLYLLARHAHDGYVSADRAQPNAAVVHSRRFLSAEGLESSMQIALAEASLAALAAR